MVSVVMALTSQVMGLISPVMALTSPVMALIRLVITLKSIIISGVSSIKLKEGHLRWVPAWVSLRALSAAFDESLKQV